MKLLLLCFWCAIYLRLVQWENVAFKLTDSCTTHTHFQRIRGFYSCFYPVRLTLTNPTRTSDYSWITVQRCCCRLWCCGVVVVVYRGPTCLEWPRESGCLKKESGSFLILMGRDGGCRLALLGFITALKRASSSVCESPRTCTICCPAGGAPWCASMSPKFGVAAKKSKFDTQNGTKRAQSRGALEVDAGALRFWSDLFTISVPTSTPPPPPNSPPFELLCPCVSVSSRNISEI